MYTITIYTTDLNTGKNYKKTRTCNESELERYEEDIKFNAVYRTEDGMHIKPIKLIVH